MTEKRDEDTPKPVEATAGDRRRTRVEDGVSKAGNAA